MAKPTGALLSFSATGTIAKTAVYASWRGRQYVRRWVNPHNPRTSFQTATRDVFSWLSNAWKEMPTDLQAVYTAAAKGRPLTDRNVWVKTNLPLLRGSSSLNPMIFSPSAGGGLAPTGITVTPGVGTLSVDAPAPTLPAGWTLNTYSVAALKDGSPSPTTPIEWHYVTGMPSPQTLTGLTGGQLYILGAWYSFVKPDLSVAYGVSLTATGTPT